MSPVQATNPQNTCETCGGPATRRFCSRSCSDTARRAPGWKKAVLVVALPVKLPLKLPPVLTAEEVARAAIFVLSGKVVDVMKAIATLEATPWPIDTDDE